MKSLKYIIFLLLILIIGFAIYVAVQPNAYEVTRSRTINVPKEVIYNNVNDFRNWESWSAWIEKKPDTKITYPEQTKGLGGSYSWEDDDGPGQMKTIAVNPYSSIEQELQFDDYEPSKVSWNFNSTDNNQTEVSWTMKGHNAPFGLKVFAAISGGFDNMIGPDFERGLEKMDSLLVASTKKYTVEVNGITEYGGSFYLYKTTNAKDSNISQKMAEQYGSLMSYIAKNNIQISGMPLTVYNEMNTENGNVIMSNGLPVNQKTEVTEDSDVTCGYIPKMRVLKTTLTGNYTNLGHAWQVALKHISENNLQPSEEKPFEIYTNDPGQFPNPADWKTEIYMPLKSEENL